MDQIKITSNIPVYYINLENNKDRNIYMQTMLNTYNFTNITRISAIDTRKIETIIEYKNMVVPDIFHDLEIANRDGCVKEHKSLRNGAIGCYLSHLKIYEDIVKQNVPFALVLEDDCKILLPVEKFWSIISNIIFPSDCDIFLLDSKLYDYENYNSNLYKVYYFFRTHSYIITLNGSKKMIDKLLPIDMQLDSKISLLNYTKAIVTYQSKMLLTMQSGFKSDIQNLLCKSNIFTEIMKMKKSNNYGIKFHLYKLYLIQLFKQFFNHIYNYIYNRIFYLINY